MSYGFRVTGFRVRVLGFGFDVWGFGFSVSGLRFRVSGFVFQVSLSHFSPTRDDGCGCGGCLFFSGEGTAVDA